MDTPETSQRGHVPGRAPAGNGAPDVAVPREAAKDADNAWAQRRPEEIKQYHRLKRGIHIADLAISLVYWGACSMLGASLASRLWAEVPYRWPAILLTAVILLGGHVLVDLPLSFYSGYIIEKRYQLSNQTPWAWAVFQVKGWLVGAVIGGILLVGLYGLLFYGGTAWPVWLWIGVMLLTVGLAKLFPLVILPLFYPSTPLDRPSLTERLSQMARGGGMRITGVYNLGLSKETKKANAMLAGLGSSRRVYLSDTLLEAFDDDQIAVVFAHELGHHIRRHIWKGIALTAAMSSLLVAVIYWLLHPWTGAPASESVGAIAALAQVMLIATVLPLLLSPMINAISRHFERQCDSDALRLTDNPAAYRAAFNKLSLLNMADPDPPRWEEILFDDHPALSKRIAMADAYERARAN